ncbi:MAG: hypothetical protein ABI759_02795 [Candidatus Solibacter sp.]
MTFLQSGKTVAVTSALLLAGAVARPMIAGSACTQAELKKSAVQGFRVYAPDGKRFLMNQKDAKGTEQVYLGQDATPDLTCVTCVQVDGGPKPERFKMQAHWHPSGNWISVAVERDTYSPSPLFGWNRSWVEGQLQSGLWTNMYLMSPDGKKWNRLTDFQSGKTGIADGFTGTAFTPDGKKAVWSQIIDGNILAYYPFGRWQLMVADLTVQGGVPALTNARDITPRNLYWNEPGNFHSDGKRILLTGSDQKDAQGMDLYTLDIETGILINLTNSPTVWDEHGVFSPNGEQIVFMSAYPYRSDPGASKIFSIKTEFMLLDVRTRELTQLTHYRQSGYPEYSFWGGIAATGAWSADGRSLSLARLFFPAYEYWDLRFQGACGTLVQ